MSHKVYWSDNWFRAHHIDKQIDRLKHKVLDARDDAGADLRSILAAIDQLEVDIGRTLLKVQAIVAVLEEKGLVATDELASKAAELDAIDGKQDGILHPAVFRTEEEQQRAPSPRAFLIALEKETVSPREFLAELEQQDQSKRDD